MLITYDDFYKSFDIQNVTYDEFCKRLSVLDVTDRSGTFAVRSDIYTFINRVVKKDSDKRKEQLDTYMKNLYRMLVTDAKESLYTWYRRYVELTEDINFYFKLPDGNCLTDDTFYGMAHSKYGRLSKHLNHKDFYNTKKLYSKDSEYVYGLIKAMYERFHIRNSLVGPAFFDHIVNMTDYKQVWTDFWMGANKASVFNPYTYKSILDVAFKGDTLFAPVMGWNSYQQAFYSSKFKHFIATDVMPGVVDNSNTLHNLWEQYRDSSIFEIDEKTIDCYLCPSEQLDARYGFVNKYKDSVDAVLLSPPYFDLEIYPGEEQSINSFPDYDAWLEGYWHETVKMCKQVMKPGAKFGFIISNYRNFKKNDNTISSDMKAVVEKELTFDTHYKVKWSSMSGSRQAKKMRDGNYEDLWVFVK